jgi:integrase/recombinase XerC
LHARAARDRSVSNLVAVDGSDTVPLRNDSATTPSTRTGFAVSTAMGAIDLDLIDFIHWGKNLAGLADTTLRVRYDVLCRVHAFIDIPLRDAQPGHLLRWEQHAVVGRAPESRRAYVSHVRSFYKWAVRTGIVSEDPTTLLTMPKIHRKLPRPIAEDDLAAAIAKARPKMRAMLILGAYAGLRCCEIAGLDWSDLHREGATTLLTVRKAKGGHQRVVEIGETVLTALKGLGIRRRGPMFFGNDGRQLNAHSVSASGNRYLRAHGIEATMHQLRHRYGSVGYQVSRDLRLIQEQMGHASPTSTAIYTRPSADAAAAMVAAMDLLSREGKIA